MYACVCSVHMKVCICMYACECICVLYLQEIQSAKFVHYIMHAQMHKCTYAYTAHGALRNVTYNHMHTRAHTNT
jgi:hypothetical protein